MLEIMRYGEVKHIRLNLHNRKNEPFEIISAEYSMISQNGEVIESGMATIIEHTIDVLVTPPAPGNYNLRYTYYIGDETRITDVELRCV